MISSCPLSWNDPENSTSISVECAARVTGNSFPPVTDRKTGLVYKNEFCARCNDVKELVAWGSSLACYDLVYEKLSNMSISALLQEDPDIFKRECTECMFRPPAVPSTVRQPRSCIPGLKTCLPRWQLELSTFSYVDDDYYNVIVDGCHSGPMDLVKSFLDNTIYYNPDCASCNGEEYTYDCLQLEQVNATTVNRICLSCNPPPGVPPPDPNPFSFIITLSSLASGQVIVSTGTDQASFPANCSDGEVPVGLECRETQCPEGYSSIGGLCSYAAPVVVVNVGSGEADNISDIFSVNCSDAMIVLNVTVFTDLGNNSILLENGVVVTNVLDYDELGRPVICDGNKTNSLNCSSELVHLEESEYENLGNGSILFNSQVINISFLDSKQRPLVCPDLLNDFTTQVGLFIDLPGLEELTYIGCSLSILGTVAVLVTYFIFTELHTFPGLVLINLCMTFLATDLIFITGGPTVSHFPLKELCTTLAITLHFFYLAQFSWMSIFSCEMLRNFYQASQFANDTRKAKKRFFAIYLMIGWLPPLGISIITISLNFSVEGLVLYGVNREGNIDKCWINDYNSFLVSFLTPLVLSLTCNLVMLVVTTILLFRAYRDQSKVEKSNNGTIFRVWLAVFSITGLTWVFGFMALFRFTSWMWYPFVIFNSTHGFGVFLAFIVTKKVFNMYVDLFTGKRQAKSLSFRNKSNASVRSNSSSSFQRRNTDSFRASGSLANGSFKANGSFTANGSFRANGNLGNGCVRPNGTSHTTVHCTVNGTHSKANGTHIKANETHIKANGTHVKANGTHVKANGTHIKANGITNNDKLKCGVV